MESAAGAGRSCGTCTLCCTVLRVDPLRKLGGTDCVHQRRGARGGCAIHGRPERPALCGRYRCAWLQGHFGDADRPDRLGAVLDFERSPTGAVLVVREAQPGAFEASARLQQIAARQRAVAPVRITTAHDVLDAGRPHRELCPDGDELRIEGEWTLRLRAGRVVERRRLPWLERMVRRFALALRRRRTRGYRGASPR